MCKIFFFLSLSPAEKLKTPPHNSSVYVICVFFLGEPENPLLWYPLNRGHDLDFFLIFPPPDFLLFPPMWYPFGGTIRVLSFFFFSFPPVFLCLNIHVIFGSCPLRNRSKDKNLLPALFHFSSLSPQHALSFCDFCVSPLGCLLCVITVVLFSLPWHCDAIAPYR